MRILILLALSATYTTSSGQVIPPAPTDIYCPAPPFQIAEIQPKLIGGLDSLQIQVKYPEFAYHANIEGQVIIQFMVDELGKVLNPEVLSSPNDLLSKAALDALNKSRFTPGLQRGRTVKVRYTLPVTFRLSEH